MKVRITFKDTDTLHDCVEEDVKQSIVDELFPDGNTTLDEDEIEALVEKRKEKVLELCSKWFEYSEYICLEVDTETESIRVLTVEEANRD